MSTSSAFDQYEAFACALCNNLFDLEERRPKLLSCLHTVCIACASVDEACTCPFCDVVTPLQVSSADDDVNQYLQDNCLMVEHLALSRTRRRVSHPKSSSGAAPKGAKRVDGSSTNADVDDEAAQNLAAAEASVLGRCVAHDEDFKYVCNQCAVPVCVSCTVLIDGGHHAHGMISLDKVCGFKTLRDNAYFGHS